MFLTGDTANYRGGKAGDRVQRERGSSEGSERRKKIGKVGSAWVGSLLLSCQSCCEIGKKILIGRGERGEKVRVRGDVE